jgi:hypothetical protein
MPEIDLLRCRKTYTVSIGALSEVLRFMDGRHAFTTDPELPPDAIIAEVHPCPQQLALHLHIVSAAFPPVPEGNLLDGPWLRFNVQEIEPEVVLTENSVAEALACVQLWAAKWGKMSDFERLAAELGLGAPPVCADLVVEDDGDA